LVICMVEFTDTILFLTSFNEAISLLSFLMMEER
jgi:hypothetical protein